LDRTESSVGSPRGRTADSRRFGLPMVPQKLFIAIREPDHDSCRNPALNSKFQLAREPVLE
jgi:hypothetical protein